MTKSRHRIATRHVWTAAEDAVIRQRFPDTRTREIATQLSLPEHIIYKRAAALGVKKTAEYMASPAACRLRRGDQVGKAYRYPKGHVPANKGKRGQPSVGRMAQTQFKKGQKPHTWQPVGSARIDDDGYHYVKLAETKPPRFGWIQVHRLVWELHRGAIPPGHIICFRDGDKNHIAIDNLECITLRENMLRNTLHNLPPAVVEVIQLRAAINHRITTKTRKANEQRNQPTK